MRLFLAFSPELPARGDRLVPGQVIVIDVPHQLSDGETRRPSYIGPYRQTGR